MSEKIYNAAGEELNVANNRVPLPTDTVLSADYIRVLKSSWNAFLGETDGNYDRIPFIIHTDQHINKSSSDTANDFYAVMNAIDTNCDWDKISKIINLGDFVERDVLEKTNAWLPSEKVLNVPGNHDLTGKGADHTTVMKYFPCGNARQFNKNEWWSIIDDQRNVKYLVVNDFESETAGYWLQSIEQVRWVISELEKADGYDIVILAHGNFADGIAQSIDRSGAASAWSAGRWDKEPTADASWHQLLAARKNKQSGTYTDGDGNAAPYDFSHCKSELLMSFHGHHHFEKYVNLNNSITSYICECFCVYNPLVNKGSTFYLGYIDRVAKKFKNWKLYNGITRVDAQEIDIN